MRLASLLISAAVFIVGAGLALAALFDGSFIAAAIAGGATVIAFLLTLQRRVPLRSQVLDEFEGQFME